MQMKTDEDRLCFKLDINIPENATGTDIFIDGNGVFRSGVIH